MIWSIREFIVGSAGLSIGVGVVGAGSLIRSLTWSKPLEFNSTIGQTSIQYTTKNQWRFLYLLADKVFEYLQQNKNAKKNPHKDKIGAEGKASVIDWLKSKFNIDNFETQDKWESFRDICTKALAKENRVGWGEVEVRESRLCFMGKSEKEDNNQFSHITLQLRNAGEKGNLGKWSSEKTKEEQDAPYQKLTAFTVKYWTKYNYQLWSDFKKSSHGNQVADNNEIGYEDFKKAWDDWYKTAYSKGTSPSDGGKKFIYTLKTKQPTTNEIFKSK